MSYWRTFLVVVLLALSLPMQSFAAVSMQCAGAAVPHEEKAPHAMPAGALKRFGTVLRVESVVLGGVLMVAAVLVSSALPGTV